MTTKIRHAAKGYWSSLMFRKLANMPREATRSDIQKQLFEHGCA